MSDFQSPEQPRPKESKFQLHINRQKAYLMQRTIKEGRSVDDQQLTAHARDRVAARLKLEKRARELVKLREESETDPLTGLLNLNGFNKQMAMEVKRIQRLKTKSVVVTLDVNDLKPVNDLEGHEAGDRLLKKTANSLRDASRLTDTISKETKNGKEARVGGDEFRVILPDTNLDEAQIWWERVNSSFRANGIKISAGVAEINPNNPQQSINESDQAMYAAKGISKKTDANLMLRFKQIKSQ